MSAQEGRTHQTLQWIRFLLALCSWLFLAAPKRQPLCFEISDTHMELL